MIGRATSTAIWISLTFITSSPVFGQDCEYHPKELVSLNFTDSFRAGEPKPHGTDSSFGGEVVSVSEDSIITLKTTRFFVFSSYRELYIDVLCAHPATLRLLIQGRYLECTQVIAKERQGQVGIGKEVLVSRCVLSIGNSSDDIIQLRNLSETIGEIRFN